MPRFRFFRTLLCLFALGSLANTGCEPANMGALRGVVEKVGAKMVNRSSDEDIREMFRKANDQCPVKMDAYTTLERVTMIDEQNIEFHYKVNQKGRNLVKGLSKDRMRQNAVQHMRGNPMAVAVAERDLTIQHIYEDQFGGHILSYTINKGVLSGQQPIPREQDNPFAVKTVKAEAAKGENEFVNEEADVSEPDAAESTKAVAAEEEPEFEQPLDLELEPEFEPEPDPADLLPQPYKPAERTKENPAGIQSNPFFN